MVLAGPGLNVSEVRIRPAEVTVKLPPAAGSFARTSAPTIVHGSTEGIAVTVGMTLFPRRSSFAPHPPGDLKPEPSHAGNTLSGIVMGLVRLSGRGERALHLPRSGPHLLRRCFHHAFWRRAIVPWGTPVAFARAFPTGSHQPATLGPGTAVTRPGTAVRGQFPLGRSGISRILTRHGMIYTT